MLLKEYSKRKDLEGASGIYKFKCGGHLYVGSSKNLRARLCEHNCDLSCNKHCNDFMQKAYNKYGEQEFSFEIIEFCKTEELLQKESYWIKELKSDMNLQDPLTHKFLTEGTRKKISQKSKSAYVEGRSLRRFDKNEIEAYDIFGNYIKTFIDKKDAATQLNCSLKKINYVAGGYRDGKNHEGIRLRYSDSKVPVLKFNIDPKRIGAYYDFYIVKENGSEEYAFSNIRNA